MIFNYIYLLLTIFIISFKKKGCWVIMMDLFENLQPKHACSATHLPWVNENPTKGKWRAEKAGLAGGGQASWLLVSESSTSKLLVSVGLETSGMYGALLSLNVPQSTPSNHGWPCTGGEHINRICLLQRFVNYITELFLWNMIRRIILILSSLQITDFTVSDSVMILSYQWRYSVLYLKILNAILP